MQEHNEFMKQLLQATGTQDFEIEKKELKDIIKAACLESKLPLQIYSILASIIVSLYQNSDENNDKKS